MHGLHKACSHVATNHVLLPFLSGPLCAWVSPSASFSIANCSVLITPWARVLVQHSMFFSKHALQLPSVVKQTGQAQGHLFAAWHGVTSPPSRCVSACCGPHESHPDGMPDGRISASTFLAGSAQITVRLLGTIATWRCACMADGTILQGKCGLLTMLQ